MPGAGPEAVLGWLPAGTIDRGPVCANPPCEKTIAASQTTTAARPDLAVCLALLLLAKHLEFCFGYHMGDFPSLRLNKLNQRHHGAINNTADNGENNQQAKERRHSQCSKLAYGVAHGAIIFAYIEGLRNRCRQLGTLIGLKLC
ncbi:MAG: hypothetical protein ACC634_08170 [Hyphomicrobiales bacterium]